MNDTIWSTESLSQGADIVSTGQSYKTSLPSPIQLSSDKVTTVLKWSACIVIGIIGVFGNAMTLTAYRTTPRLWTKSNMLLASLISTHLFMATIVLPCVGILNLYVYMFAENPCYFKANAVWFPFPKIIAHTIFSHFIIIAVDRYIAVLYPLHYETKMTVTVVKYLIGGSFAFGLTISGIYFSYLHYIDWLSCGIPFSIVMLASIDCGVHFAMMMVTILVYGRVFGVALKHRSKISSIAMTSQEASTVVNTISDSVVVPYRGGKTENPKIKKTLKEFKAARMTAVLVCAYTLPLLPFDIGRIMQACGNTQPYATQLVDVGSALGNLNTGFDWVIYGIMNRTFRQAFYRLLKIKSNDPNFD